MERDPQQLSYYERLGVSEDADLEEIAAAYRALRKHLHPDTKPDAYRDYFDHMTKGINEAYDVLKDPAKRRRYDTGLSSNRQRGRREQSPPRQHDDEKKSTRGRSRKTTDYDSRQQYSFHGEMPTASDYERLVDSYEDCVESLESINAQAKDMVCVITDHYERIGKKIESHLQSASDPNRRSELRKLYRDTIRKFAQSEQDWKSVFSKAHRDCDGEEFRELLAAIEYVEGYLVGLPKQRRIRLSSKYGKLKREAADLINKQIVH